VHSVPDCWFCPGDVTGWGCAVPPPPGAAFALAEGGGALEAGGALDWLPVFFVSQAARLAVSAGATSKAASNRLTIFSLEMEEPGERCGVPRALPGRVRTTVA